MQSYINSFKPINIYLILNLECRYISTLFNQKGRYEGGTFTQSAYEIVIENMDFNAKTIRLIDSRGNQVCEKDIQSLEVLETIQRIKITI